MESLCKLYTVVDILNAEGLKSVTVWDSTMCEGAHSQGGLGAVLYQSNSQFKFIKILILGECGAED